MSQRFIRLSQLSSTKDRPGLFPVSPATIWRWVREGKMPKPFKLGEGITVWERSEIERFIAECAATACDNDNAVADSPGSPARTGRALFPHTTST